MHYIQFLESLTVDAFNTAHLTFP